MIYRRAAGSEPGYAWLASCQLDASRCEATAPRPSRSRQPVPRRPRPRTGRRSPAPAPAAEGALARSHPGFGSLSWTATRAHSSKIISYCPSSDADKGSEGAPSRAAMSTTVTRRYFQQLASPSNFWPTKGGRLYSRIHARAKPDQRPIDKDGSFVVRRMREDKNAAWLIARPALHS